MIELEVGTLPIMNHTYKHPKRIKHEIERDIQEILELGLIIPSTNPFDSSVVLVNKKDGTLRMCIYYRYLNNNTINKWYPIPRIDELMGYMGPSLSPILTFILDIIKSE